MSQDELEEALAMLAAPRGGGPGPNAARDAALGVLQAHPDLAHPRLLAMAKAGHPPPLILLALATFGRAESIPVLARALRDGDAPTTVIAGDALARHRLPEARATLEAALTGTSGQTAMAAAVGLAQRRDPAALPALRAASAAWPPGEVRDGIEAAITALA
jgi:HEAT repeat protein